MILATEQLRQMKIFYEKSALAFFDTMMAMALKYIDLPKSKVTTVGC
jgi:hypothetical protein